MVHILLGERMEVFELQIVFFFLVFKCRDLGRNWSASL
jgi:hypothetical protein